MRNGSPNKPRSYFQKSEVDDQDSHISICWETQTGDRNETTTNNNNMSDSKLHKLQL